jgi:hypothetical protein
VAGAVASRGLAARGANVDGGQCAGPGARGVVTGASFRRRERVESGIAFTRRRKRRSSSSVPSGRHALPRSCLCIAFILASRLALLLVILSERLAETAGDARIRETAGAGEVPLDDHDGPGARAGDRPGVSPTSELPDSDTCRAERRAWCGPIGWRSGSHLRASAMSTGTSVSRTVVSRQSRSSSGPGTWRTPTCSTASTARRARRPRAAALGSSGRASHEQQHRAAHPPVGRFLGRRRRQRRF